MAAAIIQHYKVQGGQQQPQPGKRDLAVGEAGFGAVERTGYPEPMGLKATTHSTGGYKAVKSLDSHKNVFNQPQILKKLLKL